MNIEQAKATINDSNSSFYLLSGTRTHYPGNNNTISKIIVSVPQANIDQPNKTIEITPNKLHELASRNNDHDTEETLKRAASDLNSATSPIDAKKLKNAIQIYIDDQSSTNPPTNPSSPPSTPQTTAEGVEERLQMAHEDQQGHYTQQLAALEALHRQHIANLQVEFGRQRDLLLETLRASEAGHADRMHHYEQQLGTQQRAHQQQLDGRQAAHEQQMTQLNERFQVQLQQLTIENGDHIASLERKIRELTDLQQRSQEQITGLTTALEEHTAVAARQLQLQQQLVERLERLVLASQEQIVALIRTLEEERATRAETQQNMEAATAALTGATAALPQAVAALTAATEELRAAADSGGGAAAALGATAAIGMIYERLNKISEQMEAMSNAYAANCFSTIQSSTQQLDELTKMGETISFDIENL